MDQSIASAQRIKELFGEGGLPDHPRDAALVDAARRFTFGTIFTRGGMTDRQRLLVCLAVLTASAAHGELADYTRAALRAGLTPAEIKEAVYQCAPYIGHPKVFEALERVNGATDAAADAQQVRQTGRTTEEPRFQEGIRTRAAIFGEGTYKTVENAPPETKHIQEYLCAYCFGEFYTREALDLKTRELLTLCILCALGGCESQVRAHVKANLNVGNGAALQIDALTHCIPYVGFPRALNAIDCVAELTGK